MKNNIDNINKNNYLREYKKTKNKARQIYSQLNPENVKNIELLFSVIKSVASLESPHRDSLWLDF